MKPIYIFVNLGTLYRLVKRYEAKNFYLFKKTKCYLKALLDQADFRVNFKVSVNLAKNLLVKF